MNRIRIFIIISICGAVLVSGCINALYDKDGYCDVHHVKMKKRLVMVNYYGMAKGWPDQQYPNKKSPIQGGCVVRMEKFGVKYVCKVCTNGAKKK
ncbi:MAG: hypothetical protein U0U66_08795 [Cytophagaceae bacterium]